MRACVLADDVFAIAHRFAYHAVRLPGHRVLHAVDRVMKVEDPASVVRAWV